MKMEQMENGCLKIWLDEPDMREMGLRFEDMDYRNAATREAITRLLETAREETGFEAPDGLLVEVLPLDKGCLILMTPSRTAPASVSSERRKFRMVRAGGPFVYAVDNVDQLFQLCAGLRRFRRSGGDAWFREPASSLYRFGNGYRLVIYPGFVTPRGMSGMLSEFGRLVGEGDAAAAFTAEHGQPLAIGDAVDQLGRCS